MAGNLDPAFAAPRSCAGPFVPKQFAFQHGRGNSGTVDLEQWCIRFRAKIVNDGSQQVLADSTLAADEQGRAGRGYATNVRQQFQRDRVLSDPICKEAFAVGR